MELLPITSILSACVKGTSSAKLLAGAGSPAQRRGSLRQGEREQVDVPRWLHSPRCTLQREDTSHHTLEGMKSVPGKITEVMRVALFCGSHSCPPPAQLQSPRAQDGDAAALLCGDRQVFWPSDVFRC